MKRVKRVARKVDRLRTFGDYKFSPIIRKLNPKKGPGYFPRKKGYGKTKDRRM